MVNLNLHGSVLRAPAVEDKAGAAAAAVTVSGAAHAVPAEAGSATLLDYVRIARPDHWVKNVFALPGIVAALALDPSRANSDILLPIVLGLISLCTVASSNYVINEILDAPTDRHHPEKWQRPVASGRIRLPLAYAQWLLLMVAGVALGFAVSPAFGVTMIALWVMGCIYNIPPVRAKDVAYLDVLTESVNNPLRLLAGWYIVLPVVLPPASLLLCYWMIGAYFMAIKRFAEYRCIGDPVRASSYRKSFGQYTDARLLISILFYSSAGMLFFGAFLMRYRIELVLAFPFVAWVMAAYMAIGLKEDSAAQAPEHLYRERHLMLAVGICTAVFAVLWTLDLPALHDLLTPTVPALLAP
jgi:decaprenyl-phosphate phosphoribosyltransferase